MTEGLGLIGFPLQGNAALESWNGKLASGTTPYQVANINSITYQVVSGVLITTDLSVTNGVHTVNLVATQHLSSQVGSSMLSTTTVAAPVGTGAAAVSGAAVALAALGGVALLVVLSVSAVAGTVVYRKHRKAQRTLAQQEPDQFSPHAQIEMDMIMQGIQSSKEEEEEEETGDGARLKAAHTDGGGGEKPTWRMRIKSITARSPTILVEGSNTSRRPVPLGGIVAAGRPPQQQQQKGPKA
ncbi:uncharacterized protein ACA1_030070 [Acanthamoeba castellanii str. Neff]|uniref:Uncharacterized protein n=1 Tax=Acanthamoeba castellanii (strain ATCC 30010 / Neff) TaxID=1257118 RepID=L8H4Y9_ACACF|nr:uncharacterized protein ACA1_030070 [Acanthamoeba castellanii str. Neff]ELR20297.1 hypothetical protein ACA1_030070 [Acanthamoeba castellanii str. Neff]